MELFVHLLAAMGVGHFLCDFPLQGDFLARAKNPTAPLPNVPWEWAMAAHSAIHAGCVWVCTGSLLLGCSEYLSHWWIDVCKCRGRISFGGDQMAHLLCKAVFALAVVLNSEVR